MTQTPWLIQPTPRHSTRMRLFCLPCAGGGASFYRLWQSKLPDDIEVIPICLPGREQRLGEPAIDHIDQMVPGLEKAVLPLLDLPFAFFGYSMGGIIAHHLACHLAIQGHHTPAHLFIAALRGPDLPLSRPPVHALPSNELWQHIANYGGTPKEILESAEFRALLEPSLRADFKLVETTSSRNLQKLNCPVTVFGGTTDTSPRPGELAGWHQATNAHVTIHTYHGGHFFIQDHQNTLLSIIASEMSGKIFNPKNANEKNLASTADENVLK
ncbi:thioesterase [Thalassospira sp. NFXS8]|uniref:thioesterase II family protein n=1 Tax=Thalassospira sp. NFXS8 TaxID=2819093 RepID=UPI0032DE71CC